MYCLIDVLHQVGLKPYLFHFKGGSAYIKFNTRVSGTLRVANHPQRSRYHYRWNLRADYADPNIKDFGGQSAYYYPFDQVDQMIADMLVVADLLLEAS